MRLFILILLPLLPFGSIAQNNTLTIKVSHLESLKGQVILDIFQSEKGYPMETQYAMIRKKIRIPSSGNVKFLLDNLPEGEYAFALIHDENMNGELDLNFIGIPKEGAGASNNATGFMSPPSYDSAKFLFNKPLEVSIKMLYF